jgi:predicted flap endonuclease-1-like 5' DNA nuclease
VVPEPQPAPVPPAAESSIAERVPDLSGMRSVRSEAFRTSDSMALSAPAKPDDLKRIRGVGLLIERKLNAMGIATYEQIANWTADDVGMVNAKLEFKGRIERENWIEQARILASGGHTDFSRRFERGEI